MPDNTLKKGDIISITFRNGVDAEGNPVLTTLDRAEVLGCSGGKLQIAYRDLDKSHSDAELDLLEFDIHNSDIVTQQCELTDSGRKK